MTEKCIHGKGEDCPSCQIIREYKFKNASLEREIALLNIDNEYHKTQIDIFAKRAEESEKNKALMQDLAEARGRLLDELRATLREREAELTEAKKTIDSLHEEVLDEIQHRDHFENQCSDMAAQAGCSEEWSNLHDHSTCVRDEVQALLNHHDELEARLSDKESTVARLREALEDAIQSVRGPVHYSPFPVYMPQIGVEFVKRWEEALSPSPSAKSGGRDLKTEMEMWDSNAKVEDWRLQRYGECAACGGNLTAGHQCPRRKSVSPSANSGEKP